MTHPAVRDEASAEWFDGLNRGALLIRRCRGCRRASRPETTACPGCRGDDLAWVAATGAATVVATIVDSTGGGPVTLGLVELDEGPWLHVRLTGAPSFGNRVWLTIETAAAGEPIPVFGV